MLKKKKAPVKKQKKQKERKLLMFFSLAMLIVGGAIALAISQQHTGFLSKASTDVSISAVDDAFVSQSAPTKNYGSDPALKVDLEKVSYLKFDFSQLNGQPITKATLRLYVTNDSNVTQTIKEVSDTSWTEATLTFNNKPALGATIGQITSTVLSTWKEIDITPWVTAHSGQIASLAIDTTGNNNLYLGSRQSTTQPVIIVQTEAASATNTPTPTTEAPTATPTPSVGADTPTPTVTPSPTTPVGGGLRSINVSTSSQLTAALSDARAGDVITMADGVYQAKLKSTIPVGSTYYTAAFIISKSGTAANPIVLQGSRNARIDGGGLGGYYGLYLIQANYVYVKGITVENGDKGIIFDKSSNNTLDSVEVRSIHDEGVHLRGLSSDNVIKNSYIHDIGKNKTTGVIDNHYGEGVYIGSANSSNWCTYSNCQPDASDRNQIINNTIKYTGGECVDVKEGSSNGLIENNTFDKQGITTKAASWMDIKGNSWTITGNQGFNSTENGYELHVVLTGWGKSNVFSNNSASNTGAYGFWIQNNATANNPTGNKVLCNNTVTNAASGFANVACTN